MTRPGRLGLGAAACLAIALAGHGCAARVERPTLREALEKPTPAEKLRRDLRQLFQDANVDHANWGVVAFSLSRGELLYSFNAFKLLVPASSQKLFSAAVAAERLGWQHRFRTRIVATGPIGPDGTLDGDLVVIGNGDPTINPRHPERWRAFDDWAAQLAARGIRIVSGHLVGDDNAFEEPGWGAGWAWDDLQYGYGAQASALQYHENQVELLIGPGMEPGARAVISTSPLGSGLIIDHDVVTGPGGGETRLEISRVPGTMFLTVRGVIAADARPRTEYAAVDNPTRMYVNALREALARHGIFVAGSALDIDELKVPPDTGRGITLVRDESPPLAEIIDVALRHSRNIYAETLLYALSPEGRPASAEAGLDVMRETLRSWGVTPESYIARDGSGLSRYDYASANAFSWLLMYLYSDPTHAERFRAALPVAGVSGSLERRMKGAAAEGRVVAKTGSMTSVRSLSGYLTTLDGEPVVFSFLVNGYRVPASEIEAVMDKALDVLVRYRRTP